MNGTRIERAHNYPTNMRHLFTTYAALQVGAVLTTFTSSAFSPET